MPVPEQLHQIGHRPRSPCRTSRTPCCPVADIPRFRGSVEECAALTLFGRVVAGVPHVEVRDQLAAALEHVQQRDRPVRADQTGGGVQDRDLRPVRARRVGLEPMAPTYGLLDMTAYGRQETWEDSPSGWPQHWEPGTREIMRTDGRPTAQWSRWNPDAPTTSAPPGADATDHSADAATCSRRVSTSAGPSVIAMVCSLCEVRDPSAERMVHPSGS